MTAFDAHAHVLVPELVRDAEPGEGWGPMVRWVVLHPNAERELRRVAVWGGQRG
jgi:hypothetical protein